MGVENKVSTEPGARQRIDKWLWAARFFKTRSLAADALGKGRVRIGGAPVKPAREVKVGEQLELTLESGVWLVEVRGVCELRGPASVAQTLYAETAAGRAARLAELERRRDYREPAAQLHGRPSKRDRRLIDKLSGER